MPTPLEFWSQYEGKRVSVNYFDSEMWIDGLFVRGIELGEELTFLLLRLENGSDFLVDVQHLIAVEVRPSTQGPTLSSVS